MEIDLSELPRLKKIVGWYVTAIVSGTPNSKKSGPIREIRSSPSGGIEIHCAFVNLWVREAPGQPWREMGGVTKRDRVIVIEPLRDSPRGNFEKRADGRLVREVLSEDPPEFRRISRIDIYPPTLGPLEE